jgi:hypothetical protein
MLDGALNRIGWLGHATASWQRSAASVCCRLSHVNQCAHVIFWTTSGLVLQRRRCDLRVNEYTP